MEEFFIFLWASQKTSTYSSNEIRKTQNEHLIICCQNFIGEFKVDFIFFGVYTAWFFI